MASGIDIPINITVSSEMAFLCLDIVNIYLKNNSDKRYVEVLKNKESNVDQIIILSKEDEDEE